MANFKLSPTVIGQMRDKLQALINRRLATIVNDFPLTKDQVQLCIVMPELRGALRTFVQCGAKMDTTYAVYGTFQLPEVTSGVVHITTPNTLFVPIRNYIRQPIRHHGPAFYVDHLSATELEQLTVWYKTAFLEAKLAYVTKTVVNSYFMQMDALSVGSIMARWPTLSLLVCDPLWKARFASPPASLKRYRWHNGDWLSRWAKAMKIADILITSAIMMPSHTPEQSQRIVGKVVAWEH